VSALSIPPFVSLHDVHERPKVALGLFICVSTLMKTWGMLVLN
jgi:hypothetical protein